MKNYTKIILTTPMSIALVLLNTAVHAEETLQLDGTKSSIQFVGSKPDGKHNGGFAKISGTLSVDGENIKATTMEAKASKKIQQGQFSELQQIKKMGKDTVEWMKKIFEKESAPATLG